MLTKTDTSLVLIVIALALGCYFLFNLSRDVEKLVIIEVDGHKIKNIELPQNLILDCLGKDGPIKIEIDGSKVRVLNSSCPNRICVKSGWIKKRGESIICIPNRTVIKILGEEKEFDDITR